MPPSARGALHALVDQALVGRVLVHDDDAVAGLRQQVGLVELRPGGPERRILVGDRRRGGGFVHPHVRRGLGREARLGRFGEAADRWPVAGPRPVAGGRAGRAPRIPAAGRPGRRLIAVAEAPGPDGVERAGAAPGRSPVEGARQRVADGRDHEAAHQVGVAEPDLRFGGMDVDVDGAGPAGQEQGHDGKPPLRDVVHVAGVERGGEQLVAHRPAVDEEVLAVARAAMEGRQPDEARRGDALAVRTLAFGPQRQRVVDEIVADDLGDPRQAPLVVLPAGEVVEADGRRPLERQVDGGIGHGEAAQRVGHGRSLGPVALQELQACRGGAEQVAHLDGRAGAARGGTDRGRDAGIDRDGVGAVGRRRAAGDVEPRHRADRRQGFAPEPQRGDVEQVAVRQFRGRVALDGEGEVIGVHAATVVGNADQRTTGRFDAHRDAARPGVDRVLDQFLDGGGGALHHLAGGDAVDQDRVEAAHRHGGYVRPAARAVKGDGPVLPRPVSASLRPAGRRRLSPAGPACP